MRPAGQGLRWITVHSSCETVFDNGGVNVLFIDSIGVSRRAGTSFRPLFSVASAFGCLPFPSSTAICSRVGQFSDGLIHRHGLGARNDAFYTGEIRILAWKWPLSRPASLRAQRLNGTPGGGVVGGDDGINFVVIRG